MTMLVRVVEQEASSGLVSTRQQAGRTGEKAATLKADVKTSGSTEWSVREARPAMLGMGVVGARVCAETLR